MIINLLKKNLSILDFKQKKIIAYLVLMQIITTILELANIALIIPLADSFFNSKTEFNYLNIYLKFFDSSSSASIFYLLTILFSIIYFFKNLLYILFNFIESKRVYLIGYQISNRIVKNFFLNENYFLTDNASKIQVIYSDVREFVGNCLKPLLHLFRDLIILFSILIFLLIYDYKKFLFLLIFLFIILLVFSFLKNSIHKYGSIRRKAEQNKLVDLQNIIYSFLEIKVYFREVFFLNRFKNNNFLNHYYQGINAFLSSISRGVIEILLIIILLFFLIFSYISDLAADYKVISDNLVFIVALLRFLPLVSRINVSINTMRFGFPSIQVIQDYLKNNFDSVVPNNKIKKKITFNQHIKIKNLSYAFNNKNYLFKNLNFKIKKNSIIKIIGPSGSGKSTLARILMGFEKFKTGSILVDNKNISNDSISWINKIAYLPQKIYLFPGTVKENIVFGEDDKIFDNKKFDIAMQKSNLNKRFLPSSIIRENAQNISGGEAQRIALARAMYNSREILIFDEPTNGLDKLNINLFEKLLIKLSKEKTIIVITHDQNFLKKIKNIIDLKKIKI